LVLFWEPVIRPLLEAVSPRVIVEVGALEAGTTVKLLDFAAPRDECVVHSIDPAPGEAFDLEGLEKRYGDRLVFHPTLSLEALPRIDGIDAVLIDGDHNWYTVYNELTVLSKRAEEAGRPFPLTMVHDVDWPYGRRDGYYNPETIPAQHRQPHHKAGIVYGQDELADGRGMNQGVDNAIAEGTPRNGVLTAIEDFLAERGSAIELNLVVGFHGLGILVSSDQARRNERLRACLDEFESPAWLKEQCRRVEQSRLYFRMLRARGG
jgi:hypothetical protein